MFDESSVFIEEKPEQTENVTVFHLKLKKIEINFNVIHGFTISVLFVIKL